MLNHQCVIKLVFYLFSIHLFCYKRMLNHQCIIKLVFYLFSIQDVEKSVEETKIWKLGRTVAEKIGQIIEKIRPKPSNNEGTCDSYPQMSLFVR